ncbi:hypothetical protein PENSPDRAFT_684214 [Peniophora sp. CONT]|nr:hypothetical protein PENSPDRAFT_684214 [Peniophora sp. CONT]
MLSDDAFFRFLSLPRELQVSILSSLSLRDVSRITEVCRTLHNLVRNTPALQYPMELVACGMRDNLQSTTPLVQRLDHLRQHDQAWRTLSWTNNVALTVPPRGRVYCRQGVLLVAKERTHPGLGVDVQQLPAMTRNVPHQVWTIEPRRNGGSDSDGRGQIYEVDASQDLVIIRQGTTPDNTFFAMYTLSEGLPHPQAVLPRFRISNSGFSDSHPSTTSGAFIRRDWVYLFDQKFEIYNWKTGDIVVQLAQSRFSMLDECAFVDDRHFSTLCVSLGSSPAALLIYELPQSDPDVPRRYPANIPALAFLLPEIEDDQDTETHWELVGGAAHSSTDSNVTSGGDFTTNGDDTLLMILFRLEHQWYDIVVPTQRLLDFLPDPAGVSMNANMLALREVVWSEWGPQNTRLRRIPARQDGQDRGQLQATLFGMRRVLYHPVHTSTGEMAARVEDYHSNRVRRAEAQESASFVVHHGDVAEGGWLGENMLHTELPFIQTDMIFPDKWQGMELEDICAFVNEDGIIGAIREHGEEHNEARTL